MFRFLIAISLLCLLEQIDAYCCFRDPWMLSSTCGCPDFYTPCGVIQCPNSNIGSGCGCGQPSCSSSLCNCGLPACSSYRDTSNVCFVSDNPSPICSCLKTVNDDCGCDNIRSFIYFPEVEYPLMALEMKPFYYSDCWCY